MKGTHGNFSTFQCLQCFPSKDRKYETFRLIWSHCSATNTKVKLSNYCQWRLSASAKAAEDFLDTIGFVLISSLYRILDVLWRKINTWITNDQYENTSRYVSTITNLVAVVEVVKNKINELQCILGAILSQKVLLLFSVATLRVKSAIKFRVFTLPFYFLLNKVPTRNWFKFAAFGGRWVGYLLYAFDLAVHYLTICLGTSLIDRGWQLSLPVWRA